MKKLYTGCIYILKNENKFEITVNVAKYEVFYLHRSFGNL